MSLRYLCGALCALVLGLPATAVAADGKPEAAVPARVDSAIRARLGAALGETGITDIAVSPVAGLYRVVLETGETAYVTADGVYLFTGDLLQTMPGKGLVNVSDQGQEARRRDALAKVSPADMVTFKAKGKEKAEVYVFTDVDCGYCRRLHNEMAQYNAAGITVHYLAFPRSGVNGDTYAKMQGVWCAADRNKAMTDVKRGSRPLAAALACKSPVADQYRLGVALGVRGTPAIFTSSGEQVGGYLSAADLTARLGLR